MMDSHRQAGNRKVMSHQMLSICNSMPVSVAISNVIANTDLQFSHYRIDIMLSIAFLI